MSFNKLNIPQGTKFVHIDESWNCNGMCNSNGEKYHNSTWLGRRLGFNDDKDFGGWLRGESEEFAKLEKISDEILHLERQVNTFEIELDNVLTSMEANKNNEAEFDKLEVRANKLERMLTETESNITAKENEGMAIVGNDTSLRNKFNREGRSVARKNKRDAKNKVKADLRAKYGKGSDYRNAKKKAYDKIKTEKKEDTKKYGGNFGRRFLRYFPASAAMRGLFLGLISNNFWDWANTLQKVKDINTAESKSIYKEFTDAWFKFGGSEASFNRAIKDGSTKRALIIRFKKKSNAIGYYYPTGAEESAVASTTPMIVTYAKVFAQTATSITKLIGAFKKLDKEDEKNMEDEVPRIQEEDIKKNPDLTDKQRKDLLNQMPISIWWWVGGGVVILGTIITVVLMSNKKSKN